MWLKVFEGSVDQYGPPTRAWTGREAFSELLSHGIECSRREGNL